MSSDVKALFERSVREMRPAFKRELAELLADISSERSSMDETIDQPVEVDHQAAGPRTSPSTGPPRWYRPVGLVAAMTLAVLAGLLLVGPRATHAAPSSPPSSSCAASATELGVVQTKTVDIRVGLMPDGRSFCLGGGPSSSGSGSNVDLLVNGSTDATPTVPAIVEQGSVAGTAYWYVVAVPDGMPVAYVESAGDRMSTFPARIGRRLLVIDPRFDLRQIDDLNFEINLYSSSGVVLGTILVPIDAIAESVTDSTGVRTKDSQP